MENVLDSVLQGVIDMAMQTSPYAQITMGALPSENGICMSASAGAANETYYNRADNYYLTVVLNGKHHQQKTVFDALTAIHKRLTRAFVYPSNEEWQVYSITTISAPTYLGRQDDGQWLYGSSLRINFYWRNLNAY